jgi:hypothetical protein
MGAYFEFLGALDTDFDDFGGSGNTYGRFSWTILLVWGWDILINYSFLAMF